MRAGVLAVLSAGAAAFLAACGGSSSAAPIASGDASRLRQDVHAIRAAATAERPASAHHAITVLRTDVGRMIKTGRLSRVDGRLLLLEADHVNSRISVEVHRVAPTASPVQPSATPTTPPVPSVTPPSAQDGQAHGKGHGRGNGKGGGDGGD